LSTAPVPERTICPKRPGRLWINCPGAGGGVRSSHRWPVFHVATERPGRVTASAGLDKWSVPASAAVDKLSGRGSDEFCPRVTGLSLVPPRKDPGVSPPGPLWTNCPFRHGRCGQIVQARGGGRTGRHPDIGPLVTTRSHRTLNIWISKPNARRDVLPRTPHTASGQGRSPAADVGRRRRTNCREPGSDQVSVFQRGLFGQFVQTPASHSVLLLLTESHLTA
jgi:hypothetical protein